MVVIVVVTDFIGFDPLSLRGYVLLGPRPRWQTNFAETASSTELP